MADLALVTQAGPEHAVPATKTFTTQLAALAVLAIGLGADLDPGQLRSVPDEIERMLATGLDEILDPIVAELDRGGRRGGVRARAWPTRRPWNSRSSSRRRATCTRWGCPGPTCCTARSRWWTPQTPAILLAADSGPALPGTIELARRVVAAGARAYAIGGGPGLAAASSRAVPGLPLPEWLAPFGLIVPGQLLTEALSRRLGIDPDSPRGLSKVTQTT